MGNTGGVTINDILTLSHDERKRFALACATRAATVALKFRGERRLKLCNDTTEAFLDGNSDTARMLEAIGALDDAIANMGDVRRGAEHVPTVAIDVDGRTDILNAATATRLAAHIALLECVSPFDVFVAAMYARIALAPEDSGETRETEYEWQRELFNTLTRPVEGETHASTD